MHDNINLTVKRETSREWREGGGGCMRMTCNDLSGRQQSAKVQLSDQGGGVGTHTTVRVIF